MGDVYGSRAWFKPAYSLAVGALIGFSLVACAPGQGPVQFPWVLQPPAVPSGQTSQPQRPVVPAPPRTTPPSSTSIPPAPPPVTYPPGLHGDYANYPGLRDFIGKMNREHGFNVAFLEQTFSGVKRDQAALTKVGAPAEGQGWRAYRPIFLTEERIRGGVDFWNRHAPLLDAASRQYGVDIEYIVAIIGVETQYGKNTGAHNVLQALTTLGFDYPKRGDFYRKELEQLFLLSREEKVRPAIFNGSYAGAMGLGQFISSSYRNYAVDGNRDGKRDLWNPQDAIPSVANYFARNGWKRGGGVAVPAVVSGGGAGLADTTPKKPSRTLGELANAGVRPQAGLNSARVSLLKLEGSTDEYWVGGENFYVITRYNANLKYAMAVHQLAQAIRQRKFGL